MSQELPYSGMAAKEVRNKGVGKKIKWKESAEEDSENRTKKQKKIYQDLLVFENILVFSEEITAPPESDLSTT